MAISNYSELTTAIYKWLIKDSNDPFFDSATCDNVIFLAEKELSRRLKIRQTEADATLSLTAGNNTVAAPTNLAQTKLIYFGTPQNEVRPVSPSFFAVNNLYGQSGPPRFYYLDGSNFVFNTPDTNYTLGLIYYADVTGLSGSNTTNDLLTKYPDLYLAACLKQAYNLLEDTDNELKTEAKLTALIDSVNKAEQRSNAANNLRGSARAI